MCDNQKGHDREPLSTDTEYEYVTSEISAHIERSIDAFKLFAKLFSAIVGGSVWLNINKSAASSSTTQTYAHLSDALVVLLTVMMAVMIYEGLHGWYGYREAQSRIAVRLASGALKVPMPKHRAAVLEITMIIVMVAACVLFWIFNPFTLGAT